MNDTQIDRLPKKILLATDLTPACDRAFERAVQLAEQWDAELTVFHVVESSSLRPWGIADRTKLAESEIANLVRDGRPHLKHDIKSLVVVGDPSERVVAMARRDACDLLITGPAHDGTFGQKLFGSTAARILRHTDRPVLAVRKRHHGPYAKISVAVDFSPPSRGAFDFALALFPKAAFTLVHAYEVSLDWGGRNADRAMDEVEADEKQRVLRTLEQDMQSFLRANDPAGSIHTILEQGPPTRVMAEHVDKHWPDLIVTGTYGRSGIEQALIGSVAEGLLRSLMCDVLAVRPKVEKTTV